MLRESHPQAVYLKTRWHSNLAFQSGIFQTTPNCNIKSNCSTQIWPQLVAACSGCWMWTSGGDEPTLWQDTQHSQRRFITMKQYISSKATRHFSPAASLAA